MCSHSDHENINDAVELIMRRLKTKMFTDERGTTAIEFAIVGPIFIFLVIGIAFLCMGLAVAGSMHYAVEEGARCASVRKTVCSDEDTTIAYIKAHYFGPGGVPTFAYDPAAACGHSVTTSISYVVNMGLRQFPCRLQLRRAFRKRSFGFRSSARQERRCPSLLNARHPRWT